MVNTDRPWIGSEPIRFVPASTANMIERGVSEFGRRIRVARFQCKTVTEVTHPFRRIVACPDIFDRVPLLDMIPLWIEPGFKNRMQRFAPITKIFVVRPGWGAVFDDDGGDNRTL